MSSQNTAKGNSDENSSCLDPAILQKQLATARKEINNLRQQLNTLNLVHKKELQAINNKLESWQCVTCRQNQSCSLQPITSSREQNFNFSANYIGKIITHFPEKRGTPRQPGICKDLTAKLIVNNDIFTNPEHALQGLQEFSHMWILFHFHKNESTHIKAKIAPPRLNGIRTGVFATRSPHRPAPIGLSLVKIDRIMDNIIYFSGVDMINDTPVLDIKPYIPHYDNPVYLNEINENPIVASTSQTDESNRTHEQNRSFADEENSQILYNNREMDGEENNRQEHIIGAVAANSDSRPEEPFVIRHSNSRMGEREAPDGEEEETPRTLQNSTTSQPINTPDSHVRVPAWIDQPLVPRLTVVFKERALLQLSRLGQEGEEKKTTITNVLREDPRSIFLRERWGGHCYVFRIADLHVSCKFNDSTHSVTVYQACPNATPQVDE